MKRKFIFFIFILIGIGLKAQIDSTLLIKSPKSVSGSNMNMDAVYNRPFLVGNSLIAVGGYLEADYQYMGSDGISEGHQFSIPRMTIFIAGSMHRNIRFLSELEIEEGGKEISIEFAAMDIILHPLLNFRGGVIMNPIGAFNQNHDGPKWEFIERPIAMTEMLATTWSNVGFGAYGKYVKDQWAFSYEYYLTNGFDQSIIDNEEGKTFLPAAKMNKERFVESSNGRMLQTAKLGLKYKSFELGLSYMGGVYNQAEIDGIDLDKARKVHVFDLDFNYKISEIQLIGEIALVKVDVPLTYSQQFGNKQAGSYIDIIVPVYKKPFWGFKNPVLNTAVRLEHVDWNIDRFVQTDEIIGHHLSALVLGLSFRPISSTVIRLNYRFIQEVDLLGNPAILSRGIQFGFASYF